MGKRKKDREVEVAEVSIMNLVGDIERVAEHFCIRRGSIPIDLAVRERLNVPRGKVLIYADDEKWGRLILLHRPEDYEAVHAMLHRADMKLKDVEQNPEATEEALL
jgi:hypothetical protein